MIPRVAQRGHSFKGASLYYLHDKQADTNERVKWTYIHNIPTQDPQKAFGYMAHTAMNADKLKYRSGTSKVGRKRTAGSVYSFSLAWHPEQAPEPTMMQNGALEVLAELGLSEHEAVFVAHDDRPHPHVHVICNLIHPENGKTAVPSYDFLITSKWAEQLEREDGKIYCEQRVINNEKRRDLAKDGRQMALVKQREARIAKAQHIQNLYEQADSGKAFKAALEQEGYALAKGDRRGFVLVDHEGKIVSLSRQLKGQRAADIKSRLEGLGELPLAKDVSADRQHFDRDQYETDRQKKIVDGAIEEYEKKKSQKPEMGAQKPTKAKNAEQPENELKPMTNPDEHLDRLDKIRAWEQMTDLARARLDEQQAAYGREGLLEKIQTLETRLEKLKGPFANMLGKRKDLEHELEGLRQNLGSIDQRIEEQNQTFEIKANENKPDFPAEDEREAELKRRADLIRDQLKNPDRNKDHGPDFSP